MFREDKEKWNNKHVKSSEEIYSLFACVENFEKFNFYVTFEKNEQQKNPLLT